MTAASADRRNYRSDNTTLPATYRRLTAENAVTYYKGALIADVGGAARKVTGTSGLKIIGWCEDESFVGSTTDPALMDVTVHSGLIHLALAGSNTPSASDSSNLMYAVDDQTVGTSSVGGTLSPVGRLVRIESVAGVDMALVEVGLVNSTVVDLASSYMQLVTAASTANGEGASLVGIEDAGGFTSAATVEAALAELYQNAKSVQGFIDLRPTSFTLLTGAPLAAFSNGASAVPGLSIDDSKSQSIRWNNNATLDGILTSFGMPPDADITANATVTIYASKTGATVGDAVTFAVGAYNQVVGALHDADTNFGGTSGAMTGNATAKTVQAVTRTLALADLAASPANVTITIKPTDGTLGTDDLCLQRVRITYKKKILTS